jgi:acetyltransferase-like isoleucine patch superfamily enzyme
MIGANATVLAGVTVGDGATISAHSLVNHDVSPASFVGGVPAREISADRRKLQKI